MISVKFILVIWPKYTLFLLSWEYKIEEGDIILFDFNPDSDGGLHLIMVGLTTTEDPAESTY
jgi:hypothetical protein